MIPRVCMPVLVLAVAFNHCSFLWMTAQAQAKAEEDVAATDALTLAVAVAGVGGGSASGAGNGDSGGGGNSGGSGSTFNTVQHGTASGPVYFNGITVDAVGDIYIAGDSYGKLDGNIRTGLSDFFYTQYDANRTLRFSRQLGVAGTTTNGKAIAADSAGNAYVTGETFGNLDGQFKLGTWDTFLTKYDSNGVKQFTKLLGGIGGTTSGVAITIDAADNVYVAGYTRVYLMGETRTGLQDMQLTKYDTNGNRQWTRLLGTSGKLTFGRAVAHDASGNVYVAGTTAGPLDGNPLKGLIDMFVTKYDTNGNRLWTRMTGASGGITTAWGVATDASGNAYVTGETSVGLDGVALSGSTDTFLIKYDPSGGKIFTKLFGLSGASVQAYAVATDSTGGVYVSGATNRGLDGNALVGTGDLFLSKFDPSGSRLFTRQLGAPGDYSSGRGIAVDAADRIYAGGRTTGGVDGNDPIGGQDFFFTKYDTDGVQL